MKDSIIKRITWLLLGIISLLMGYYVILHNIYTLMTTVVVSMALVLYIKIKYVGRNKEDP
jgi:hypothetical protein